MPPHSHTHTESHAWTHPIPCLQVLALFAGQPYDSQLGDLGNLDAHLTNTCRLEGGVEKEQAVRLLSELPQVYLFLVQAYIPLFNPKTSVLTRKCHPYPGNLYNSELPGDSKNVQRCFLHGRLIIGRSFRRAPSRQAAVRAATSLCLYTNFYTSIMTTELMLIHLCKLVVSQAGKQDS